ncbi:hypothetical protein GX48_05246 [Paracoccidioides brasiliensis]|nr:hypothetical protein GX48_05246 [Paracoccidioides brasiliensis]
MVSLTIVSLFPTYSFGNDKSKPSSHSQSGDETKFKMKSRPQPLTHHQTIFRAGQHVVSNFHQNDTIRDPTPSQIKPPSKPTRHHVTSPQAFLHNTSAKKKKHAINAPWQRAHRAISYPSLNPSSSHARLPTSPENLRLPPSSN